MRKIIFSFSVLIVIALFSSCDESRSAKDDKIYSIPTGDQTRCISFENQTGEKGRGGMENKGGKGHPYDQVKAGESVVLLDVEGPGVIRHIWATLGQQDVEMLRGLRLDMYWDGATKPAVSVPWGDFFGVGLGLHPANETEFFSNPEGRSFNASIPMPFKKSAKIVLTNELDRDCKWIFYEINYTIAPEADNNALYFHAYWSRDINTTPGRDFDILPKVKGKGRYLGCNIGINVNFEYEDSWWGEGVVKMYIDGDTDYPTVVGTGTEDYIGTAWGQKAFNHRYQGCLVADEKNKQWAFYRYQVKDPVYFYKDFKTSILQIGGNRKSNVLNLIEKGANLIPVTFQYDSDSLRQFVKFLENPDIKLSSSDFSNEGWTNFYRSDDLSATAYFYLNKPESNLPALADVNMRTRDMRIDNTGKKAWEE